MLDPLIIIILMIFKSISTLLLSSVAVSKILSGHHTSSHLKGDSLKLLQNEYDLYLNQMKGSPYFNLYSFDAFASNIKSIQEHNA